GQAGIDHHGEAEVVHEVPPVVASARSSRGLTEVRGRLRARPASARLAGVCRMATVTSAETREAAGIRPHTSTSSTRALGTVCAYATQPSDVAATNAYCRTSGRIR